MSDQTAIVPVEGAYLAPVATVTTILQAYQAKKDLISKVLREGVDFGTIPGVGDKPALKKPGAEKLANFFGLCPTFEDVETIEDWTGADHGGEPLFYYRQRCKLYRGDRMIAAADGSCNSRETKYRYRWVSEADIPTGYELTELKTRGGRISEFAFAVEKAETSGKYGKPAEYWKRFQDAIANGTATAIKKKIKSGEARDAWEIDSTLYRIPNDDISEQINTILKMAQKRALVAATLIATGASDYFTQDIDDFVIEGEYHASNPEPSAFEKACARLTPKGARYDSLTSEQLAVIANTAKYEDWRKDARMILENRAQSGDPMGDASAPADPAEGQQALI
jgi:hypothetical protein